MKIQTPSKSPKRPGYKCKVLVKELTFLEYCLSWIFGHSYQYQGKNYFILVRFANGDVCGVDYKTASSEFLTTYLNSYINSNHDTKHQYHHSQEVQLYFTRIPKKAMDSDPDMLENLSIN